MNIFDKNTGFFIADPESKPFSEKEILQAEINKSYNSMVLSASGWRKIFAANGDEESTAPEITEADKVIAGTIALAFSIFLKEKTDNINPSAAIGIDSRFTGPAIADIFIRMLITENINIKYLFITAAPEIMTYSKTNRNIDGFIYISASHNPIGYNGVKFGLNNGGVLNGKNAGELLGLFEQKINKTENRDFIQNKVNSASTITLKEIYKDISTCKNEALSAYSDFSEIVITDIQNTAKRKKMRTFLKEKAEKDPIGILAELNGSARTLSIDESFIKSFGIKLKIINGSPREIVHRIVPEGKSLNQCRQELESIYKQDKNFTFGYVPDNDGDRGNMVYIDKKSGTAKIISAQEIFALACIAELSYITYLGNTHLIKKGKIAVVVNGPTSLRIEKIAEAFNAEVFRAEVGEANVVNLARKKRDEGYVVRIMGEGSNGGNITYPAAVRDPINTIFALVKLLLLTDSAGKKGLFRIWFEKSMQKGDFPEEFGIVDIIETIPPFSTTSAFEPEAVMKISCTDHRKLKEQYETIFNKEWNLKRDELKEKFGFYSFEEINYEGIEAKKGTGRKYRSGPETGGLKIVFNNKEEKNCAFIWMRGSGTEPVFRILADINGNDPVKEKELLNWHRNMIEQADS